MTLSRVESRAREGSLRTMPKQYDANNLTPIHQYHQCYFGAVLQVQSPERTSSYLEKMGSNQGEVADAGLPSISRVVASVLL